MFRLQQSGLPKPRRVFMVSALNGLGVKEMCRTLKDDMGFRADLWVVGAQNGKPGLLVQFLGNSVFDWVVACRLLDWTGDIMLQHV